MSDGLDPRGAAQPGMSTAYNTAGNPVSHSSQERSQAQARQDKNKTGTDGSISDRRQAGDVPVPSSHHGAGVPSSLGYGARSSEGDRGESIGEGASNTEGEQMRAPGEGEVARKQQHKDGFGEQADLASDLDRKSAEQSEARDQQWRGDGRDGGQGSGGVDVEAVLGDRVVPAAGP